MESYYRLLPPTKLGDLYVSIRGDVDYWKNFLVEDSPEDVGVTSIEVDVEIKKKIFDRTRADYLETIKGVPLISEKFMNVLIKEAKDDFKFLPATLHFPDGTEHYFAVKLLKHIEIIDKENSEFMDINGIKILSVPKIILDENAKFYIARDVNFNEYMFASAEMIKLVRENNINVGYWNY